MGHFKPNYNLLPQMGGLTLYDNQSNKGEHHKDSLPTKSKVAMRSVCPFKVNV